MTLNKKSKTELLAIAAERSIEIPADATKTDILNLISENLKQEGTQMDGDEMKDQEVGTEGTEGATTAKSKTTYTLEDGTEGSRSAYIKQEFKKDRSRAEIAKELGVKYYIVYSATANMFNAVHTEEGEHGAKASVSVARVNKDFKFINAEGTEVTTAEEAATIPRVALMKELATAGVTRSAMEKYFDVPYATVYAATKDMFESTTRVRHTLIDPETGEEVKRSEYIRKLYADGKGMTRKEIAKKLTEMTGDLIDYATVWAATKSAKEEENKGADENQETPDETLTDAASEQQPEEGTDAEVTE